MLTQARLKALIQYDPETGSFTQLIDSGRGRHKAGRRTGAPAGRYRHIWLDGKSYQEHRVAWLWMTGALPAFQIDHRNLNGLDNRWTNLREATVSQNAMNRRPRAKSGAKGVYFQTNKNKCGKKPWKVSIAKDGRSHHVGLFATFEEARAAHAAATHSLHGEFARPS